VVRRIVGWLTGGVIVQIMLLLIVLLVLGIALHHVTSAVVGACIIMIAFAVGWYPLYRLIAHLHPLLFPASLVILSAVAVPIGVWINDAVVSDADRVTTAETDIVVALVLAIGGTLYGIVFSLFDSAAYDRFVIGELARRSPASSRTDVPGVLFLEIDGLAEPILRNAMAQGYAPTMQRWLDSGSHRLCRWETDLSSQTSASQAGILLGNNTDIPAFRWYDKPRHTLMVSSSMGTARELEHTLSDGHGLLAGGGAARWSVFSGDAEDNLGVYSRLGRHMSKGHVGYYAFFSHPYALTRMFALFIAEVARERYQAWQQRVQNVQPRIRRSFRYALIRAGCTVLLQEATGFTLIADMFHGLPAVYATLFAYDEIAHHSGIDRPDAFKALTTLDQLFATLERAAARAPRPYHFVILSDHGQSQGATFRQRYGVTLAGLVNRLIADGDGSLSVMQANEGEQHLAAALDEGMRHDSRTARLIHRVLRPRSSRTKPVEEGPPQDGAVVVASGSLGLISFPQWPKRMTYEELAGAFPALLTGLAAHPGIACLLVHSDVDGGVVLGARGRYYLDRGNAVGENPLMLFGPNAAAHLKRTDHFSNVADIMVLGAYDPATGEVPAFEELVGSHGGLGGTQTEPFILYPASLPLDSATPIVGAAAVHHRLRPWVQQAMVGESQPPATDREGLREPWSKASPS
jgi:hypothetical protein